MRWIRQALGRRAPRVRAMSLALVIGTLLCLGGALFPVVSNAPVHINTIGAVLGPVMLLMVLWPTTHAERLRLHLAAVVMVAVAMALVVNAATGEGAMSAGMIVVWVGLYVTVFDSPWAARTYQAVMAVVLAASLAVNDVILAWPPAWLTLMAASVVCTEIIGAMMRSVRRMALTDPLTGLPNRQAVRASFADALAAARRRGAPLSVAVIDLDGLKRVNDELGHLAGDQLLIGTVAEVGRALAGRGVLLRLGGDEFLVLLPGATPVEAGQLLGRLQDAGWGFSFGVVDAAEAQDDLDRCLDAADARMYIQKRERQAPSAATDDIVTVEMILRS